VSAGLSQPVGHANGSDIQLLLEALSHCPDLRPCGWFGVLFDADGSISIDP